MEYFVYILKSLKDRKYYIGKTSDIEERLSARNRGSVKSTKSRRPFILVYKEKAENNSLAIKKELYYKSFKSTKDLLLYLGII